MIILVTGDRAWGDQDFLDATLDALHAADPITLLFEGCANGADICAGDHEWIDVRGKMHTGWARRRGVETRHFPAAWSAFRPKSKNRPNPAGPIRNREMLRHALEAGVDRVVAFHNDFAHSHGTRDMIKIARAAGLAVTLHSLTKKVTFEAAAPQLLGL